MSLRDEIKEFISYRNGAKRSYIAFGKQIYRTNGVSISPKTWHPNRTLILNFDIQGTKSLPLEGKVGCEATRMRWK